MRPITAGPHHALDFVTVLGFAAAPLLLGLTGPAAALAYALAAIHLTLTLLTTFHAEVRRPVSLALHGIVETVVGPVLIILPFVTGWTGTPRLFYLGAGVVIVAVRLLSDYRVDPASNAG